MQALRLTVVVVQRHQSKVKGVYESNCFQDSSTARYKLESTNGRLPISRGQLYHIFMFMVNMPD